MNRANSTVLIMAAGTGGHVFPALSVAAALREKGVNTQWLGTPAGLENKILADKNIPLHQINIKGVKGNGLLRLLVAPFMVLIATVQALRILRQVDPVCVLGMGGYICGPGGLAAKLMRKPLLLHEQNAVVGLANKLLAPLASCVMEAFPGTFAKSNKVIFTGNPVRQDIVSLAETKPHSQVGQTSSPGAFKLLVLGGSLGALAVNRLIPELLTHLRDQGHVIECIHQTGERNFGEAVDHYQSLNVDINDKQQVVGFLDDMAAAYNWADMVVCRSGASTVCELAVAALPSILIPYPHHKDQQQSRNGQWLEKAGGAYVVQQADATAEKLLQLVSSVITKPEVLQEMSANASAIAVVDAAQVIAGQCLEFAHV